MAGTNGETLTPGEQALRLLGFERVELEPGETRRVTIEADPRLLARYDGGIRSWRIQPGRYRVGVGASAVDSSAVRSVRPEVSESSSDSASRLSRYQGQGPR